MTRPIVFISHIVEERALALELKKAIEGSFLGMADVFVSSDPSDLQAGQQWQQKILNQLENASTVLLLASPQSLRRPWIGFEAGAGAIRGVPVVPICHGGVSPQTLPGPFNSFQAVDAGNAESLRLIVPTISESLGSTSPLVDFTKFVAEVKQYSKNTALLESNQITADSSQQESLSQIAIECLWTIVELYDFGDIHLASVRSAMNDLSYTNTAVVLAVLALERMGFILRHDFTQNHFFSHQRLEITDLGWTYINNNISPSKLKRDDRSLVRQSVDDNFYDSVSDSDVPF